MLSLNTKILLILFSTLAVVHSLALAYDLYWVITWLDIPMHFFGGAIVALGLYTLRDLKFPTPQLLFSFPVFIFLVVLVALAWELFEYRITTSLPADYVFDTSLDLILGTLGGITGYIIGKRLAAWEV